MKRSLMCVFAVLIAAAAPLVPARAQSVGDALPIDFMYDVLSPDGDWIYTPNYGYVWQPLASQQPGWAPYSDGSWAFTDAGWTWISNEDFGWLTYHYGRWIRLMHRWMWVPGNVWAPAWVSWRQTQGQIGWAPLPPEATWSPNVGFGGWTDSYYDVGPAYYNFVPVNMFASSGSLRPYILDRSRNFTFYDQSVNVTHTIYQPKVMNHIYVGGPDPQRINGLGGSQVRRLTLRHDEEDFRRNWLNRAGGVRPRGAGAQPRIEQGQLVVAAPSFRRGDSHTLPGRVRESLQQAEADRGWHGIADAQAAQRLREKQREELARTRPANLPEKRVQPATSTAPPPATGRVLEPEERRGRAGNNPVAAGTTPPPAEARPQAGDERRPMTPKNPLPPGGPPGVPPRTPETAPGAGSAPVPQVERPRMNRTDQDGGRGRNPDRDQGRAQGRDRDRNPPPGQRPDMPPGQRSGDGMPPGHRPRQERGNAPPAQQPLRPPTAPPSAPVAPPRAAPAPMPQPPHPQPPQVQQPPQAGSIPRMQPQAPGGPPHGPGGQKK